MSVSADQITIAITVFNRRDYVQQAIDSALNQTVPVRVMVVEDCGPDPTLQKFIQGKFGSRIDYHRNARRRGLFDNWNACIELCQTPWLSILHDDDFLNENFIASMLDLTKNASERGFYCGQVTIIDEHGDRLPLPKFPLAETWRELDLISFANLNHVLFPGQLFRVEHARALGGFRSTSLFAGDWEMWFKLSATYGAAQTREPVAFARSHTGRERGTRQIERSGKKFGLDNVQRKRNLAILKRMGYPVVFSRQPDGWDPIPTRFLVQNAANFSPRLLAYNTRLFLKSRAPNWQYAFLQRIVRILGSNVLRIVSRAWNTALAERKSRAIQGAVVN